MNEKALKWIKAAGVRALKTMAQTATSMITVGVALADIDWITVGSVSVVAGLLSLLTSIAGLPELKEWSFYGKNKRSFNTNRNLSHNQKR